MRSELLRTGLWLRQQLRLRRLLRSLLYRRPQVCRPHVQLWLRELPAHLRLHRTRLLRFALRLRRLLRSDLWPGGQLWLCRLLRAIMRLRRLRLQKEDRLLRRTVVGLRADVLGPVWRRLLRLQWRDVLERMAQRPATLLRSMQSLWPVDRPVVGRWMWLRWLQ